MLPPERCVATWRVTCVLGVDMLERGREVGVPELALDHDERDAFVRHFGYVGPVFPGGSPRWKLESVGGDRRRPAQSNSDVVSMTSSLDDDRSRHHRITAS